MSLKSKIQALISAANAKTGESDTTLTDAVQTLVDGYGQGGGGGGYTRKTYTGTIIYSDEDVSNCIIPIDTRNANHVDVNLRIVRSGTVTNGVVTYDDNVQPHNGFGAVAFSYSASTIQTTQVSYRYKEDVANESFDVPTFNASYRYATYGTRASNATISINDTVLKSNGISLSPMNASRRFCRAGLYCEFEYSVVVYE